MVSLQVSYFSMKLNDVLLWHLLFNYYPPVIESWSTCHALLLIAMKCSMSIVIVRLEAVVVDSDGKHVVGVSNFVAQTPVVSVTWPPAKASSAAWERLWLSVANCLVLYLRVSKAEDRTMCLKTVVFTVIWFRFSINKNTTSTVICCRGLLRLCSAMRVCNNISFTANWVSIDWSADQSVHCIP